MNINIPNNYALPPPPIQLNPQEQQNLILQMQLQQQQKADGLIPGLDDNDDSKRKVVNYLSKHSLSNQVF